MIEPCALQSLGFNYQIDPYVGCEHNCHYCYAQNQPDLDWENEIGICSDIKKLAEELALLTPQKIYMGMKTDPYQPLEKEYNQTRAALELLKERGFSVCILTKSNLVIRDLARDSGKLFFHPVMLIGKNCVSSWKTSGKTTISIKRIGLA